MSMTHCRSSDIFCGLKPLEKRSLFKFNILTSIICLLYTSDAADE